MAGGPSGAADGFVPFDPRIRSARVSCLAGGLIIAAWSAGFPRPGPRGRVIVIVMGVSGSGKTTIGRRLAERLGWPFCDGDDFHPPANIEKMRQGLPLTDADRAGWLTALAGLIRAHLAEGRALVLACSALKDRYRRQLRAAPAVQFVYLQGRADLILARMRTRTGHFMGPAMLASQLAALEPPADDLTVDLAPTPDEIVDEIVRALGLGARERGPDSAA